VFEKKCKNNKKKIDRYFDRIILALMERIFDTELVENESSGTACLLRYLKSAVLEDEYYYVRKSRVVSITIVVITTFIFLLVATTPVLCKGFPDFDYAKTGQLFELNEGRRLNERAFNGVIDSYEDTSLLHLIGVYDPTKLFLTVYGFSCSYQNYIISTSFKFT
jgi:hypothetical protein